MLEAFAYEDAPSGNECVWRAKVEERGASLWLPLLEDLRRWHFGLEGWTGKIISRSHG